LRLHLDQSSEADTQEGAASILATVKAIYCLAMRTSLFFTVYIIIGILVAAGIIGDEGNYFSNLDNLEEIAEMILAILLWPLVLLSVNVSIGDVNIGGGESSGGDAASAGGGAGSGSAGGAGN
jgi:hypothetical protein